MGLLGKLSTTRHACTLTFGEGGAEGVDIKGAQVLIEERKGDELARTLGAPSKFVVTPQLVGEDDFVTGVDKHFAKHAQGVGEGVDTTGKLTVLSPRLGISLRCLAAQALRRGAWP